MHYEYSTICLFLYQTPSLRIIGFFLRLLLALLYVSQVPSLLSQNIIHDAGLKDDYGLL